MMKTVLCMVSCMAVSGLLYGKPFDTAHDRPIDRLPVEDRKPVDAIHQAAKLNDWAAARKQYDAVDWGKTEQPARVLEAISKELKGDKDCEGLRREVKTKYELLKESGDPELADPITATPVPVVAIAVQRFPAMAIDQVELVALDLNGIAIPGLRFTYLDILKLEPGVLEALGIVVPVVDSKGVAVAVLRVKDEKFLALMDLWEKRFNKRLDFFDERGARIVPMGGSVLWEMRRQIMQREEVGIDTDAVWAEYHAKMQSAIGRRMNLRRRK